MVNFLWLYVKKKLLQPYIFWQKKFFWACRKIPLKKLAFFSLFFNEGKLVFLYGSYFCWRENIQIGISHAFDFHFYYSRHKAGPTANFSQYNAFFFQINKFLFSFLSYQIFIIIYLLSLKWRIEFCFYSKKATFSKMKKCWVSLPSFFF